MTDMNSPTGTSTAAPLPDRAWGAFTEEGPWALDRDSITWLPVAADLRDAARREVPVLTKAGRLPPGRRVVRVMLVLGRAVGVWMWQIGRAHV